MQNTLCDLQECSEDMCIIKDPLLLLCRSGFTQANWEMLRMGNLCLFLCAGLSYSIVLSA